MGRVVLSVLAGFVGWTVLWLSGNALLRALAPDAYADDGTTASAGLLVASVVLSVLCSLAAGFAAARIAPLRWRAVGGVLAAVLLLVGGFVQAQYWDALPLWYHLAFLALLAPATWLGAALTGRP